MSTLLYYQNDYRVFHDVTKSWKEQSIQLAYERNDLAVEIIDFPEGDYFPFTGIEGDLSYFIKNYSGDYSDLTIVVGVCPDSRKETLPQEVLNVVLAYPEISFFLEDTSFFDKIVANSGINDILVKELLQPFPQKTKLADCDIIDLVATTNLFDASNLRAVARKWKHSFLSIEDNFPSKHNLREGHLALVIDEESKQSLLNGYIMYQNGYRCLPISTLRNLKKYCSSSSAIDYSVVLRDFDLQFPDEKEEALGIKAIRTNDSITLSPVDFIRGYKMIDKHDNSYQWIDTIHGIDEEENPYWKFSDYDNGKVLFLTQGYLNLIPDPSFSGISVPEKENEKLQVVGFKKPLAGIYGSISGFKPILKSLNDSRSDIKKDIERSRKDHKHSEALDLYSIAVDIVERATYYFDGGRYILASILAKDALEILNGQHITLSVQAYHLHAVAENAIAMSVIGGNEKELAKDCETRVRIIKEDIIRLIGEIGQDPLNVLNQILGDCRLFCKDKEHFDSEDVFISEMAHLNYGLKLLNPVENFIVKAINNLERYV